MRQYREPYQKGKEIEYNEEPDLLDLMHFDKRQHSPTNRENGFRTGTISKVKSMEEGETPGGITDQNDQQVRDAAIEQFASKIKNAVSAKLMGKKINLKIKGHPDLVQQVTKLIKYEAEYLNAIMSGQASDTPALQKNKAIIEMEAKKLDRMLGTADFWPFKWGHKMKVDIKLLNEMMEEEIESTQEARKEPNDHEGRMAKSELRDMIKNGLVLYKLIGENDELPGWASSYITLASDYMHSVMEFMVEEQSSEDEPEETWHADFFWYVAIEVNVSKNKKINSIKTGDLLYYCPADLKENSHDIGIIYEIIELEIKRYKIYWNRSQMHDIYSEITLGAKLKKIISGKNMMYHIKHNEWK